MCYDRRSSSFFHNGIIIGITYHIARHANSLSVRFLSKCLTGNGNDDIPGIIKNWLLVCHSCIIYPGSSPLFVRLLGEQLFNSCIKDTSFWNGYNLRRQHLGQGLVLFNWDITNFYSVLRCIFFLPVWRMPPSVPSVVSGNRQHLSRRKNYHYWSNHVVD